MMRDYRCANRLVVALGDRIASWAVDRERQIGGRLVEQFDPLAFGREHRGNTDEALESFDFETRGGHFVKRFHTESHVIDHRPFGVAGRFAFAEHYQVIGKLHHRGLAQRSRGFAAESHPEITVRLDVAHVVVQVSHRHACLVGRRQLCPKPGGRHQQYQHRQSECANLFLHIEFPDHPAAISSRIPDFRDAFSCGVTFRSQSPTPVRRHSASENGSRRSSAVRPASDWPMASERLNCSLPVRTKRLVRPCASAKTCR